MENRRRYMNVTVSTFKSWFDAGLALVYPPACQLCGEHRAAPQEGLVCSRCRSKVRFIKPPFCERCGIPCEGEITTPFACANCRELEFQFPPSRLPSFFNHRLYLFFEARDRQVVGRRYVFPLRSEFLEFQTCSLTMMSACHQ